VYCEIYGNHIEQNMSNYFRIITELISVIYLTKCIIIDVFNIELLNVFSNILGSKYFMIRLQDNR